MAAGATRSLENSNFEAIPRGSGAFAADGLNFTHTRTLDYINNIGRGQVFQVKKTHGALLASNSAHIYIYIYILAHHTFILSI